MPKPTAQQKLQVEWRSVESLIPYARNSRTHSDEQVAQIAASIKEFGWTQPILVDGKNGIIAGHGRLLAARKLAYEKVPVIEISHLSETQKRAYVIADNKLTLNGGWDEHLLKLEFEELNMQGFDMAMTGFSTDEIKEYLTFGFSNETPEAPPENREYEACSQPGDVWLLGTHKLTCGSDTESADVIVRKWQQHTKLKAVLQADNREFDQVARQRATR